MKVPLAQRNVSEQPIRGGDLNVNAPGMNMQKSQTLINTKIKAIFDKKLEQINEVAILDADVSTSKKEMELLYDPKTGAMNALGKDAAGAYKATLTAYDAFTSEVLDGLTNEEQKFAYKARISARRLKLNSQLQKHISKETLRFDNETTDAWLALEKERTADMYLDPASVQDSIELQNAEIRSFAKRNGKSGAWSKNEQDKNTSDNHKTVIERMIVDGYGVEAQDYYKKYSSNIRDDTDIKSKIKTASSNSRAMNIANEAFGKFGPKNDFDPIDMDRQVKYAEGQTSNTDVLKTTKALIKERADIHNFSVKERIEANTSVVFKAYMEGTPSSELYSMPEFVSLPGDDQFKLQNQIEMAIAKKNKDSPEDKREQEQYRAMLMNNPALLKEVNLEEKLREGLINQTGFLALTKLKDPMRGPVAKIAFKLLDDAKRDNLYSEDEGENSSMWAETTELLTAYITNNPDGDPKEYVDQILEPVKYDNVFVRIFGGISEEEALEAKAVSLEAQAAGVKNEAYTQPQGARKTIPEQYPTATNPVTGERMIKKDGKWQLITK